MGVVYGVEVGSLILGGREGDVEWNEEENRGKGGCEGRVSGFF